METTPTIKLGDGRLLVAELPFEHLIIYADQRKLGLFVKKGTACVCCGIAGTRLVVTQSGNRRCIELVTEDGVSMTIDHIIPRNSGGPDILSNMQPMCRICNQIKSDFNFTLEELRQYIVDKFKHLVGSLDTQYSYIDQQT